MTEPIKSLESKPIPEQILRSGTTINLDLSSYFSSPFREKITYEAEGLPPGITIDSATGIISGTTLNLPLATPFLVSVTATNEEDQQKLTEYFPIIVVDIEQPLPKEHEEIIPQVIIEDYLTETQRWQLQQWINLIIQEHYACAYFYDGGYPPKSIGAFQEIKTASTGFSIYVFENCLIVSPGKMAFEDGNRGRMLRTLEEVCSNDIPKKRWSAVAIIGSDETTINKAWVIAKLYDLPVFEPAPSNEAYYIHRNLTKLPGVVRPGITKTPT
jgi:hypothetical protein